MSCHLATIDEELPDSCRHDRWASHCHNSTNAHCHPRRPSSCSIFQLSRRSSLLIDAFHNQRHQLLQSHYEANRLLSDDDADDDDTLDQDGSFFDDGSTLETCSTIFSMSEPEFPLNTNDSTCHNQSSEQDRVDIRLEQDEDKVEQEDSTAWLIASQVHHSQDTEEPFWQLMLEHQATRNQKDKEEILTKDKTPSTVSMPRQHEDLPSQCPPPARRWSLSEKTKTSLLYSTSSTIVMDRVDQRKRLRKNRSQSPTKSPNTRTMAAASTAIPQRWRHKSFQPNDDDDEQRRRRQTIGSTARRPTVPRKAGARAA